MTQHTPSLHDLEQHDAFIDRHIGPDDAEIAHMLKAVGYDSLDALVDAIVPATIRQKNPLALPPAVTETEALAKIRAIAGKNEVFKSFIGQGYHGTHTPLVILRNILENPAWYTAYTPYQAEISQGRMEALINFQTMCADLTGMEIANASLLDEATAAAEAMTLAKRSSKSKSNVFFVSKHVHPQTIEVLKTRAEPLGIALRVDDEANAANADCYGALLQYPDTFGTIHDYKLLCDALHAKGALVAVATDLLALTLITPPGEWGADIVVGNSQRFGVPFGFGGPHAAFMACRDAFKRSMPGRLIGVSKDAQGNNAYRLTLQTREQHIRREKATSNICTAQVLLAVMAAMYAVYHGPEGLVRIARRTHRLAAILATALRKTGIKVGGDFFDTLHVTGIDAHTIHAMANAAHINLRHIDDTSLAISLDETTSRDDVVQLASLFGARIDDIDALDREAADALPAPLKRTSAFLAHPVFNSYRSEHEMLRYLRQLADKDLALDRSMIPLGSCTMKLNATAEMIPITWPEFSNIHPLAPAEQWRGYRELIDSLEAQLIAITGYDAVSLQPNAGAQGEYAGLLAIRAYHHANGQTQRDVCLIPESAHGTNPASAHMCGMTVVVTKCDGNGNVDVEDIRAKAEKYTDRLAAIMLTYPSTHGVFEGTVREVCAIVHAHGGQVYMDGANMNAQVGLTRPRDIGADVCHLNLHKTFCIPHGGGGPGMGPICVAEHLRKFLPGHPVVPVGQGEHGAVSAGPWGSPSILPISYVYIKLMGAEGLTLATKIAILNANYIARRLEEHYPVLYRGANGTVAHECIVDLRPLKASAGVEVEDVAKRLMDYGFHAPTVSFPVAGTLMIEPTESESLSELDRFCEAMIAIREEIREVELGILDRYDNPLKHAPHTAAVVTADAWEHGYSRERAAFPTAWVRERKFWPFVGRVNNAAGDRNLICACVPIEDYAAMSA